MRPHRLLKLVLVTVVLGASFLNGPAAWAQTRGNSGLPAGPGNPLAALQRQIDELKALIGGGGGQLYIVTNSVTLFENGFVEVRCGDGDFVTGGGFETDGGRFGNVVDNKPSSTSSWLVAISIGPDDARPITLTGYAVCAR